MGVSTPSRSNRTASNASHDTPGPGSEGVTMTPEMYVSPRRRRRHRMASLGWLTWPPTSTCGASRPTWRSATSRSPTARSTSASPHALALIKRHAAPVNASPRCARRRRRGRGGDRRRRPARRGRRARRPVPDRRVPDRIGHVDEHERQRGAGRRWPRGRSARPVHPNDHVNASQSSNDTVPAAIRIAVARLLVDDAPPGRRDADRRAPRARRALRRRRQGRAART